MLGTFGTLRLLHVVCVVGTVVARLEQCRLYMFFWCNTVGTYAFMKAAPFMMHLHAIVQMHVLLILLIAASCCIACFELKECVGVESIGMSLELETVSSVLTQTTETFLLADLDSKQLSAC